jgi:ribonuclease P protein component
MKFTAIRENHLFGKAYRGGKKAGGKTCSVYVLKDRQARRYMLARPDKRYINRIGISASKKIGGAVQRNRAKRVIREAYRQIDKETGIRTGYLIVIVPRTECTVLKMQDVKRDLHYALAKSELLVKSEKSGKNSGSSPAPHTADTPAVPETHDDHA